MRKVAMAVGAAVVLTAGTGAAYAVVGHGSVSPTVAGNGLPIDDNHSPARTSAPARAGDDRGTVVEPGDDRGNAVEPGDDSGGGRGADDGGHR